jgi:hypothetical protein
LQNQTDTNFSGFVPDLITFLNKIHAKKSGTVLSDWTIWTVILHKTANLESEYTVIYTKQSLMKFNTQTQRYTVLTLKVQLNNIRKKMYTLIF